MTKENFLRMFEEATLAASGSLTGAERLDRLEGWDSVAVVVFIAQADEHFSVNVSDEDISRCTTVSDLWELVAGQIHV